MTASYAVLLGPVRVGQLGELRDRRWAFQFLASYRERVERPVLGQYFEDDLERTYIGKKPGRLPAFFAHLKPEGRLRTILERSLGLQDPSDAELLAAVSRDLPGAVRLVRTDAPELQVPDGVPVPDAEPSTAPAGAWRFSLGGAQLKFSMLQEGGRFTIPAHGALGSWIVKIAIATYEGLPANEFAVMSWARASGFDVPEVQLVRPDQMMQLSPWIAPGSFGLAIRRYDRDGIHRIHQEDFAQVIGLEPLPDGSEKYMQTYDNVVRLTGAIAGIDAAHEMVRRIVFVVASGNADAHLRNWSLLYRNGVRAELSPLYDQVATVAWPEVDKELALKLTSSRQFSRVDAESFAHLARRACLDTERVRRSIRECVATIRNAWPAALDAGLPPKHADALREHWKRVPLLREMGTLP